MEWKMRQIDWNMRHRRKRHSCCLFPFWPPTLDFLPFSSSNSDIPDFLSVPLQCQKSSGASEARRWGLNFERKVQLVGECKVNMDSVPE